MFGAILSVHITLGFIGLVLGPIALFARKARGTHTRVGETYHWVMFGICSSAVALAFLDWGHLWPFFYIGTGSYAFAFLGYIAAKLRWRNWLAAHLIGQCTSYIAIITALLVVNWGRLAGDYGIHEAWAWALPTVAGTPIIFWLVREVALGRRPK